jgi:hypothetical protein
MSRAKPPFRKSDLDGAYQAARDAGIDVKIEIDLDQRRMSIIPVKLGEATSDPAAA